MPQRHINYTKFIPRRKTRQNHRFKYVVHDIDEKFERRFASGYTGRQLYPGRGKAFLKAYEDAVGSKEGYLIVDTSPQGDDRYRLRSRVFPGQDPLVYRLS